MHHAVQYGTKGTARDDPKMSWRSGKLLLCGSLQPPRPPHAGSGAQSLRPKHMVCPPARNHRVRLRDQFMDHLTAKLTELFETARVIVREAIVVKAEEAQERHVHIT